MTNINNKLMNKRYEMRRIELEIERRLITSNDRIQLESLYFELLELEEELENKINNNNLTVADLGVRLSVSKTLEYACLVDCYQKSMYNIGGELTLLNQRKRKLYKDNNRLYIQINGVRVYQ